MVDYLIVLRWCNCRSSNLWGIFAHSFVRGLTFTPKFSFFCWSSRKVFRNVYFYQFSILWHQILHHKIFVYTILNILCINYYKNWFCWRILSFSSNLSKLFLIHKLSPNFSPESFLKHETFLSQLLRVCVISQNL